MDPISRFIRNAPALTLVPALFLFPAVLIAAESPEDDEKNQGYVIHDEVFVEAEIGEAPGTSTIAAKLPLSLDETPLAVGEVGQDLIEEQNAIVLGDALVNVAGVNVQSGNGIFDVFTLRGLDSSANGLILIDGAREPQTAFYQLYNVERVEVLKGASSFLYGGGSMGGSVNLVRKQPRLGQFTRVGLQGESEGGLRGTFDANYFSADERFGFRLNGQWLDVESHRDDLDNENWAVNPAFLFRPNERTTVHVNLEFVDTEATPDAGLPLVLGLSPNPALPEVDDAESYHFPGSVSDQEATRFQVDVEHRVSESLLVRNKTYWRELDWLSNSTVLNGAFPDPASGALVVNRSQLTLDDEQTFFGNQLEAAWKIDTGSVTHNLLFGLELARFEDQFTFGVGALPTLPLFDPDTSGDVVFPIPGQGFGTDAESTVVAPYVIDQVHFSERFQLLLGLRHDDIDYEDSLLGLERDDSETSPSLGFVYSPSERLSFYANWGRAFTPPSTFVVGQDRAPEESEQVEVGLRTASADGRLRASLAFYSLDRDNVAIPDATGVTRQLGEQSSDGAELELRATLRPGLELLLAYSYTDAELVRFAEQIFVVDPQTFEPVPITVDRSGNAVPWAPEHLLRLWLDQRFDDWGLGVGARFVDDQFIAADNAFAVDSHFLVDAAAWYGSGPWRLQLNLENLADEETFTRVFNSTSVIPAPGATATLGFHWGF